MAGALLASCSFRYVSCRLTEMPTHALTHTQLHKRARESTRRNFALRGLIAVGSALVGAALRCSSERCAPSNSALAGEGQQCARPTPPLFGFGSLLPIPRSPRRRSVEVPPKEHTFRRSSPACKSTWRPLAARAGRRHRSADSLPARGARGRYGPCGREILSALIAGGPTSAG